MRLMGWKYPAKDSLEKNIETETEVGTMNQQQHLFQNDTKAEGIKDITACEHCEAHPAMTRNPDKNGLGVWSLACGCTTIVGYTIERVLRCWVAGKPGSG